MTSAKWMKLNENYSDAQHYISDLKERIAELEAENERLRAERWQPDTNVLGVTLDVVPSHDGKQQLLVSSVNERGFSVLAAFKSVEAAEWFMRFWRACASELHHTDRRSTQ